MPLKLVKRHGSPFWYLPRLRPRRRCGREHKTADREQAEALRAKREWEIVNRQIGGNRAAATFLRRQPSPTWRTGNRQIGGNRAAATFLEGSRLLHGERGRGPLCRSVDRNAISRRPRFRRSDKLRSTLVVVAFFRELALAATINRKVFTPISAIMMHAAKTTRTTAATRGRRGTMPPTETSRRS